MDQRADGLEAGKDYVSVVSADNYGNGYASGTVLGDALGGKGKVAMVYYDANFAPTNQRDEGFRDAMKNYPDIEIVTEQGFTDESGCAEQEMLFLHSSRTLMVFMQAGMCLWKVFFPL